MVESYNATALAKSDSLKQECFCINDSFDEDGNNLTPYNERKYILNGTDDKDKFLLEKDFHFIVHMISDILHKDYPKLVKLRVY